VQEGGDTLYEYYVHEESGQWQHWAKRIPEWQPPEGESAGVLHSRFALILTLILEDLADSSCAKA
jgi:hypothetical protein